MDGKLIPVLLAAVLGVVTAWWTGRLGVRRTLEAKRGERSFERRLEWYERAITSLSELAAAQAHVVTSARMGFSQDIVSSNVDKMLEKQKSVSSVLVEARMYATPTAAHALVTLLSSLTSLKLITPEDSANLSKGFKLNLEDLQRSSEDIRDTTVRLTVEMREQAGYESRRQLPWWKQLTRRGA